MAQTNFTPISLYYSTTAAAVPTAGNLVAGELAINTQDGKLFYKDAAGVVQTIASKDTNSGTFTNISVSGVATFGAGTVSLPSITTTGDTNTGIFFPAADTIAFTEGGAESMRIDSSGQVGIGTSPAVRLDVRESGSTVPTVTAGTVARFYSTGASGFEAHIGIVSGNGGVSGIDFGDTDSATSGRIRYEHTNNSMQFMTNTTEKMRIDSSGNVGIGISSPSTLLHISSANTAFTATSTTATSSTQLRVVTGAGTCYFAVDGSGGASFGVANAAAVWNGINSPLLFATNNSERMRILADGKVAIGGTTAFGGARLTVYSDGLSITNGTLYRLAYQSGDGSLYFSNGTNQASLSSAGAWTNASDARLKNSIVDIKYGLETVLNTQPRSYKVNDLEGDYIGFVAQELQTVIPEVVSGNPNKQLGVDYGSLVAVAFKAIQEQQALIENLTTRLNALEGK
jgi:hypothetical protein